jgi:hypothetical protein
MEIVVGSRIHDYAKRLGIFVITVALITGIISCEGGGCGGLAEWYLGTSSSEGGQVVVSGGPTFADGTVVMLEAVADECYEFVNWTGANVSDPYSPITTITMDQAQNVTANFARLNYDLTTGSTDGGEVTSPGEDTFACDCGAVVGLAAEADEGYRFVQWTGDVGTVANVSAASTTITMQGDYAITANFIARYNLTINSTDNGEVTIPGEATFTYDAGAVVDLVADADVGYHFVEWTGDVGTVADVYAAGTTITMNGNYSITADFGPFAGGNGTAENPYQIADWYNLDNVRNYLDSHFIVMNDLDSNSIGYAELASGTANGGKGWEPIGNATHPFGGSINGQGYEVCDLFIDRPDEPDVALFGAIDQDGVIENVGVVSGNVTGYSNAGGLVGKNEGTVAEAHSSGSVNGQSNVGGLVGWNFEGTVAEAHSSGSVNGQSNVGGLVGWSTGTLSNSYATGGVTGNSSVGGLAGKNGGTLSNSYATGSVSGVDNVGGLVGKNDNTGTVSNSYATGSVTGSTHVGGLVGKNQGTVSNSFWDTQTSGQGGSAGGTGKNTTQMMDFSTFFDGGWDIVAVANSSTRNTDHIWNIVDDVTYPFLSWQPV